MVYRLWAGVRLADAIVWQESCAHVAGFGFRPARSALDGAALTQVLLDLRPLRGYAVVGMSMNYIKCVDLIPEAVVLALALELGMDPGTCRTLGAMYKQFRRALKIARALGLRSRPPGGATPRFCTPTTPPTNCWPEAPWGEGGGGGIGGGGSGRGNCGGGV